MTKATKDMKNTGDIGGESKKVQETADVECPNCNKNFTNQQVIVHTI